MDKILKNVLQPILKDDKIFMSERFKKVKLDVGLSINAPNTEIWTENENDLLVIGFEPSSLCHDSFINNNRKMAHKYPEYVFVNPNKIFDSFYPLKCALSNGEPRYQTFYNTGNDLGCSSLYEPVYFPVIEVEEVSVITLENFFDLFPWNQIPYIDQLKIDTQGSDYEVLLGAGNYLDKIVYLTLENSTHNQYKKEDDYYKFDSYLKKYNFTKISEEGINSTYLNNNHIDKIEKINFFIENK